MEKEAIILSEDGKINYANNRGDYQQEIKDLVKTWDGDTQWRLSARKILGWVVPVVLLLEVIFVLWFVWLVYYFPVKDSPISSIQTLVSALVVAVVTQTAYIFKIMVKWIFSEVNYDSHPLINKNKTK